MIFVEYQLLVLDIDLTIKVKSAINMSQGVLQYPQDIDLVI